MTSTSNFPQFSRCVHRSNISESTLSDISNDIFKEPILQDDPLWTEYTEKAALYDQRIIEDWNKIVDVTLIFVGLIISVLTSFVIETSKQFKRDPADISNDILVAIYEQLVAQANNSSAHILNIPDVFNQPKGDYKKAVILNALLYSSLGLCTVAAVVALAAKLWLISYGHRASAVGTPYDRAMIRQKAFSGVLAWKMGAAIQSLPLMLLVALIMFGFFIHESSWSTQRTIGYAVGTLLTLSFMALGVTSLAAAFVPECPFRSSFSTTIQHYFRYFEAICRRLGCELPSEGKWRWLRIVVLTVLWFGTGSVIAWVSIVHSSSLFLLICVPIAITFAYCMKEKAKHTPQKYRLPLLSLWTFLIIGPLLAAAGYFLNPQKYHTFVILYVIGLLVLFVYGIIAGQLSKSMDDTAEIDAITWLLTSASTPTPELFKKAGRIIGSPGDDKYRPRLLNHLLPLLSSLIVSHRPDMEPQDLEVYLSCLAHLSNFAVEGGSTWRLWEDAKSRPELDEKLRNTLEKLATHQSSLTRVATEILDNYKLHDQGKKRSEAGKRQKSGDEASMYSESGPYDAMELHSSQKNGYYMVNV